MRVVSVVGARPQFIKSAPVSHVLRARGHQEILVHTGQHYDDALSAAFFRELSIPEPDMNLEVGSASHGRQTARMLEGLERIIEDESPDGVIIYGDTNSTLAGALAAAKLHVPVAHVEAGLRSFNRRMPEEINRVLADHISSLLFCPTDTAVENLQKEGITEGVHRVGDTMVDTLHAALDRDGQEGVLSSRGLERREYFLSTVHRAENTDDPDRLRNIVEALDSADMPVLLPMHPRTKKIMASQGLEAKGSLRSIKPVGHMEFIALLANARAMLTDSGGVQKEAYMLGTPCITLRDETEWVETVDAGWNVVVGADREKIEKAMTTFHPSGERADLYGKGKAGDEIVSIIEKEWG
ncbi:MAG: UDP-N-acetylglucosamine 2-epimerase (non-hydrolyzing) [Thermoplasmata archaeon]|nr:UDP-N-acetylglucosamine 2-epimerase (non-hydrolyzing) [Thermoplasmata archaeon]